MEEQLTVSKNNVCTVDRLTSETTYDENGEGDAPKKEMKMQQMTCKIFHSSVVKTKVVTMKRRAM